MNSVDLLRTMIRIRLFENKVSELKNQKLIDGPVHTCIGQEAVAAGVCMALSKDDYIIGNHRSHGHLIAKGANVKSLMAQVLKGKGSSMHVFDPSVGAICSTAIVGSGLPLACGVAFASKFKKDNKVTCVFFGDGAVNEGVFYESINIASKWKLPVIFILENNNVSVTTVNEGDFADRCNSFGIFTQQITGQNVEVIYKAMNKAINIIDKRPALIECKTMRFHEHQEGPAYEKIKDCNYRNNKEVELYKKVYDPIDLQIVYLMQNYLISLSEINKIYQVEQELIDDSVNQ